MSVLLRLTKILSNYSLRDIVCYSAYTIYYVKALRILSTAFFRLKSRIVAFKLGARPMICGSMRVIKYPGSVVAIGDDFTAVSNPIRAGFLTSGMTKIQTVSPYAKVSIGDNVKATGLSLQCRSIEIRIGNNVKIGANCYITDSDFHCIEPDKRNASCFERDKPVIIEDNVWIGLNCIILKGVTIGENSIIGAGSVVTKNVDPDSIYAGNPAHFIRKI